MKKLLILIPIIAFAMFLFLARLGKYKEFHSASISGKIDTIYRYRDYVMIYVNKVEYRIIPVSLYSAPRLDNIARKGDEIHKKSGSDTFTFIHEEDEAFEYTVKKY